VNPEKTKYMLRVTSEGRAEAEHKDSEYKTIILPVVLYGF
jgi:hypothetical protein